MTELVQLADIHNFVRAARSWETNPQHVAAGSLFCPICGEQRAVDLSEWNASTSSRASTNVLMAVAGLPVPPPTGDPHPNVYYGRTFRIVCRQCGHTWAAIIHPTADGPNLLLLPSAIGAGCGPHTPSAVAYYVEQAARSKSIGAFSASAAMYRAALEMLLFDQGFEKGMLRQKIEELARDASSASPRKPWIADLDHEFLTLLKELGDGSIHTNGGDISKQTQIDRDLVDLVEGVFAGILHMVYEIPAARSDVKSSLKMKAALLRK